MSRFAGAGALALALVLMLALPSAGRADLVQTFSNAGTIEVPTTGNDAGGATPFPSAIGVSGLTGPVKTATVTLRGVNAQNLDDFDVLLVSPRGEKVLLMADACGGAQASTTLGFDDVGASSLPDNGPCPAGTYAPSNYVGNNEPDQLVPPAPDPPFAGALSAFIGTPPNGSWSLFAYDDEAPNAGSIAEGWSLTLRVTPSNVFTLGGLIPLRKGRATIVATVPGPGILTAVDANSKGAKAAKKKGKKKKQSQALIKPIQVVAAQAGPVALTVEPSSKARKRLRRGKRVAVTVRVTYTPNGGTPASQTATGTLQKPTKKKGSNEEKKK